MTDYFELLGLERNCSTNEIQKAYRKLARESHPDIVGFSGEDRFKKIKQAYETLSDPLKRQEYDDAESVRFAADPMEFARSIWKDKLRPQ